MTALLAHLLRRQRTLLLSAMILLVLIEAALVHLLASIEASGGLGDVAAALGGFLESFLKTQLPEVSGRYSLAVVFRDPALLFPLLACVLLAATQPVADLHDGRLELQLARPLSRARCLTAHLLASLVAAVALPTALVGGLALGLGTADFPGALPLSTYALCAASMFALLVFFAGFGLWLAAGARRRGPVLGILGALIVPGFLLDMLGRAWAPLAAFRPLSPFYYFDPAAVLPPPSGTVAALVPEGALGLAGIGDGVARDGFWMPELGPLGNGLLLVGFGVLFAALAFRRFLRRDL